MDVCKLKVSFIASCTAVRMCISFWPPLSCAGADGGQGDADVDEDVDEGPSMV